MNLYYYWDSLYNKAREEARKRISILRMELLFLLFLLFTKDTSLWVYLLYFTVVIAHIYTEYLKHKVDRLNMLGFKIQKIDMIQKAYKKIPSQFELADLLSESLRFLDENRNYKEMDSSDSKRNSEFNIKNKSTSEKILLSELQESSFWNYHLFKSMYIKKIKNFWFEIFIIFIGIIVGFVITSINPIKIIFVILSFGILYEMFSDIRAYERASIEMNEIDNEISRIYKDEDNQTNLLSLIVKYHYVKAMCTHIDKKVYLKYRDGLNQTWDMRIAGNIKEVLEKISIELADITDVWAITGGANLFIRDFKKRTSDIDILTTKKGLLSIAKVLNINVEDDFKKTEMGNIRSYFIQHKIDGTVIDIIGDIEVRNNNNWKSLKWHKELDIFKINELEIPTTSLKYEKFTQRIISKQAIDNMLTPKSDVI